MGFSIATATTTFRKRTPRERRSSDALFVLAKRRRHRQQLSHRGAELRYNDVEVRRRVGDGGGSGRIVAIDDARNVVAATAVVVAVVAAGGVDDTRVVSNACFSIRRGWGAANSSLLASVSNVPKSPSPSRWRQVLCLPLRAKIHSKVRRITIGSFEGISVIRYR